MGDIADYDEEQHYLSLYNEGENEMTNQPNPTRVVTEEVRFSYVSLLKPRDNPFGGEPKYSVTILLPKSDVQTKQRIDQAIEAAKQIGKQKHWNGVIPPVVATPVHDGDGVKPNDGTPYGEECKGHWVINASSKVDQPPVIVDINNNPIIDATEVYSGMYGRIAVNFGPYAVQGKKGIGCYISKNVQKTRDGEPLGATAPDASEDFGSGAPQQPQYQQAPPQQGYQQAPPQQGYQQPPQQQQAPQQAPQGQPQAPQGQPQAPQGQPQQQYDPITGAPINGGVMGI